MGEPVSPDRIRYLITEVDGINVFHPPGLLIKEGFSQIRISVRKFLFWAWLEVEGAKAIPVIN